VKWISFALQELDGAKLTFSKVQCVKLKTVVVALLATTMIASILGAGYVHTIYLATMPRTPDPAAGRIYPVVVKAVSVYVNREDLGRANFALKTLPIIGLCCFLGMVAIKQYWDK
jgi:hypothetical protein